MQIEKRAKLICGSSVYSRSDHSRRLVRWIGIQRTSRWLSNSWFIKQLRATALQYCSTMTTYTIKIGSKLGAMRTNSSVSIFWIFLVVFCLSAFFNKASAMGTLT
jgi:hypothetical protein